MVGRLRFLPGRFLNFRAIVRSITMEVASRLPLCNQEAFYNPGDTLLASPPFGYNIAEISVGHTVPHIM